MIDFTLNEEQAMLVETLHRFAEEQMRASAREAEESRQLPEKIIEAGWGFGLLPSIIPADYGGFGEPFSAVTGALAAEELAWGDLALALRVLSPGAVAVPLLLFGTEDQKQQWLPVFCDTSLPVISSALIEPRIQFDPNSLSTRARVGKNGYLLTGNKMAVSNANCAEHFLVYAEEGGETQAFWVPSDTPGVKIGERDRFMGLNALPLYSVSFSECEIPEENRLGRRQGIDFQQILNYSRITMGAAAVGVARAGYEYAREYAKQRVQFGEPIAHRQSIAFMLAEMAIDVESARMMVWEAAWLLDQGLDASNEIAVMKHFVDDMVVRVADQAVQVLGGYGYMREYPVELWLRNARGFAILEGLAI